MTNPIRVIAAAFVALAWTACVQAQSQATPNVLKLDKPENAPAAKIADAAWLQGSWAGEGLSGIVEEVWSPPHAGSMMASFRYVKDGKVVFYEMITLTEEKGTLTYRVKHFHPDLKGWEKQDEAVEFPLVRVAKEALYFDGLTMKKDNKGNLKAWVVVKDKATGTAREEPFTFKAAEKMTIKPQ